MCFKVFHKENVLIIWIFKKKFHDQYRDAKQADKTVIDIATQSYFHEIRQLLIFLLQKINVYVK